VIAIRPFKPRDLPGILRIERESFNRDAWPRQLFVEYSRNAPVVFLVATVGGSIAGYSIACFTRHGAEIVSVGVRPKFRQQGVATALLKKTLQRVKKAGAAAVWLMVRRENEGAIRLYRRLGFVRTATVRNYYEDRATAWRMRIILRSAAAPAS
jgi:[ribosomal protein S18]-alanine N-acetyltransferase